MGKEIDPSILNGIAEKIIFGVLAFISAWIVKLQTRMNKVELLEAEIKELKKSHEELKELIEDKFTSNVASLDKRVALTEQLLTEIAPLSKGCVTTTTKLTTIVEMLMDERKRQ